MRSPIGPVLVILSLATILVLVLMLFQTNGLREDLDRARAEVVTLRDQVGGLERGVPISELSMRLAELENDIQAWVVAFGEDVTPTGGSTGSSSGETASNREVLSRLDDVLDRIDDLDARVDEICGNVPVC
ncbi:MAG: hypothetical protein ACRDFY_05305 [Candidatus Limnocylindria bacterium]